MEKYRKYDNKTLKELHSVEIELLDEFVRICDKYKLTYYLSGGTLLGAVRHNGFIPWDDDIDVSMFRKDYDKFIEIAQKELDSKYYLDAFETNKDYYLPFAKIKKNKTIFDEEESTNVIHHKGIYIDIFPLDNIKNNHKLGKIRALFVRSIVEVMFYKLKIRSLNKVKHPALVLILSLLSKKSLMKWQKHLLTKNKNDESLYVCALAGSYAYEKELILREKFYPPKKVVFEGKEYNGMNDNDSYLSQVYGDYMKLPPKEKRVNHMPLKIVFDTEGNK